jgi:hypothetical protein
MKRLVLLALIACHANQVVTPPPPPLRPTPEPSPPQPATAKDCDPTDEAHELKAYSFNERSIPEASHLADEGVQLYADGISTANDTNTRNDAMTRAVKQLLAALGADPYNVKATYALAAAYARIQRPQCSLNLIARLLQMRTHPSKKAEVEAALDKLLGRKQALDPAFAEMRADDRFRSLIRKMCEGNPDPNCAR